MLARVVHGEGGGPRVVLVHGFTQTIRSWDEVAADLAGRGFEVVLVDLPGHGASAQQRPGFVEAALAIGEAGGEGLYVGYSMGGRLTLRLALDRPDLVRSVVLVGASPGYPTAEERAERRRSDALLANNLSNGDTKAFLEAWLAMPLFETSTPRSADLAARRANPADGLAYALRTLGTGSQDSLWERLAQLQPPALLVAGEHDAKFRAIAERMAAAIGPGARTLVVPDAGHAVPLDQPEALAEAIAGHAALTR